MTTQLPEMDPLWAPDACTLPTVDRPLRLAEFDDLFARSVVGVDRVDGRSARLELRPEPDLAAKAADLAVRETRCCSFFEFAVVSTGGLLTLVISVPDTQVAVLDALVERVRAAAS